MSAFFDGGPSELFEGGVPIPVPVRDRGERELEEAGAMAKFSPSTGMGTLVLISVAGLAVGVPPYIIETVRLQSVSFDMLTTPVTSDTPLLVLRRNEVRTQRC
jgi:hypothetical protein